MRAWLKSNTREPYTPFSASFQTFCVTAHAYLNTPKSADGLASPQTSFGVRLTVLKSYINMYVYRKNAYYKGKMYQV